MSQKTKNFIERMFCLYLIIAIGIMAFVIVNNFNKDKVKADSYTITLQNFCYQTISDSLVSTDYTVKIIDVTNTTEQIVFFTTFNNKSSSNINSFTCTTDHLYRIVVETPVGYSVRMQNNSVNFYTSSLDLVKNTNYALKISVELKSLAWFDDFKIY